MRIGYPALAFALLVLAASIRLPALGDRPLMHDESLFGYYSHYLWKYGAMDYDPILHGPLLLQVNAAVFSLFGDSDVTLRLFCALCGIALVAVVVWGRPLRDPWANLASGLLLAASPTLCYYSRFCRNDIPFTLFTAVWVAACAGYCRTGRARWGAAAVLAFAAMACIKEVIVFLIATSLAFGALLVVVDVFAGMAGTGAAGLPPRVFDLRRFVRINNTVLIGVTVLYLLYARDSRLASLSAVAVFAMLSAGAACVSASLTVGVCVVTNRAGAEGLAARGWAGLKRDRYTLGAAAGAGLILFLMVYNYWQIGGFSPFGVAGQIVRRLSGAGDASIQWVKDPAIRNTAGTLGFFDIIGAAVHYWWDQHHEHRLRGPFHYYVPILAVYEWPALLMALAGATVAWTRSRTRLAAAAVALSGAGVLTWLGLAALSPEQLDLWLHIQSPAHLAAALILGGLTLVVVVAELRAGRKARAFLVFWTASVAAGLSYAGEKVPWLAAHIALPLALLAGDYAAEFLRWGLRRRAVVTVCAALGLAFPAGLKWSQDTGALLANGFDPAERMVFNHTTPAVKVHAAEILATRERCAARGEAFEVAMTGEASWPLFWYLRDLPGSELTTTADALTSCSARIVICDPESLDLHRELKDAYQVRRRVLREAWVPPPVWIGRVFMKPPPDSDWPVAPDTADMVREARWLWRYWLRRELFPGADAEGAAPPLAGQPFIFARRAPPAGAQRALPMRAAGLDSFPRASALLP